MYSFKRLGFVMLQGVFVALLLPAVAAASWTEDIPPAALAWAQTHARQVIRAEASPDGTCLALATSTGLAVMKANGTTVWEQPYVNQWLAASVAAWWDVRGLAVAPGCRWIAVAGSPGYRYVWLFGVHGEPRKHFATPGTPKALAIGNKGDLLAVGTAGGHLLLVNSRGAVQNDVTLSESLYIIDELQFSPDDALLLTTRAGGTTALMTKAGEPLWTRDQGFWMTTTVTPDWERFLIVGLPGHGEMVGGLELVTRDGRTLWEDSVLYPIVSVTPDGRNFVIASEPLQGYESEATASFLLPRTVLDRDGKVVPSGTP